MMADNYYDVVITWTGSKVMADYYDPNDLSTPLGQVEVRMPEGEEPYIASEDNQGRNLLPPLFCYNAMGVSVVDVPKAVLYRLADPCEIPIRNRFGRPLVCYTASTTYACPLTASR